MASFDKPKSLTERLADEARMLLEEAELLPPGAVRDAVIHKARQSYTAAHLDAWVNSRGLQPPT